MDPTRFDHLVRALATKGPRRRVVAVLAALPLVGVLAGITDEHAAAEKPQDRLQRRKAHRRRKQRHRKQQNQNTRKNGNTNKGNTRNKGNKGGGGKGGEEPTACTANGQACQQNRDCCSNNCFGQRCAAPVTQCGGVDCPAGATGCCAGTCCTAPANQCNAAGLCCAPNCDGKQCGPDGCGGSGTCGSCQNGQTCDPMSGQCQGSCTPSGQACQRNRDCCGGNCFFQVCTAPVSRCGGVECPAGSTGCCSDTCCQSPANLCNLVGECCEFDCAGRACGPDGCGGLCGNCLPGQSCDADGQCTGTPTCSPQNCQGCCDRQGTCQPGTAFGMCGIGGDACFACEFPNTECLGGQCLCTRQSCPDGCCENGPGQIGMCLTDDPGFCGTGGERCRRPDGDVCTDGSDCCSGNCFNSVCADLVTVCGVRTCNEPSPGCCGNNCCDGDPDPEFRGTHCCDGTCCEADKHCCGDSCCSPDNSVCCGNNCCPAGSECCGINCCPAGSVCCEGSCCPTGSECCGSSCCAPGTLCCGDTCCNALSVACCNGKNCCDQACCGDICCAPLYACCGNSECCDPVRQICCGGNCVPADQTCCANTGCKADETCCIDSGGNGECCQTGQTCNAGFCS